MLISFWLNSVRNRLQSSARMVTRRRYLKPDVHSAENLEIRSLLTSLAGVRPNVGTFLVDGDIRNVAPQELTLQFSLGEAIDVSSISTNSIQVQRAGNDGSFTNGNEVPVTVGFVGIGSVSNEVVLRFGENLPDDKYRITVKGTGTNRLTSSGGVPYNNGVDTTFGFELDLGAQVTAVVPQPVTVNANGSVTQALNQIVVYFNDDDLTTTSAQNPAFYQLIYTKDTVTNLDDVSFSPTSVVYNATNNTSTLTFSSSLDTLAGPGGGTFRLRVGNSNPRPEAPVSRSVTVDPADNFAAADKVLGTISNPGQTSQLITSAIDARPYAFIFPGGDTDLGNRQVEVEEHLHGAADTTGGTTQISYNFRKIYGTDPVGNPLTNLITESQKERAREVFEIYSNYLGIDFRETDGDGLTIVTGDMRAMDPNIPTGPGGVGGLAGGSMAIMDQAENWSDGAGGSWFYVAMHEIGHLLGYGHTYDLPALTIMGSGEDGSTNDGIEPDFPGDADIVHGQYLHRPDSIDIDMYQFQVGAGRKGRFTAEVIAERQANSSRLDSVLKLYRQNANGSRELISRNDDYFSQDSFLQMELAEGTYFIGVSSTGNEAYDPSVAGTGFGGTSQGPYQLRLDFRADEVTTLVDTTGVKFDGDSDGQAGGVYNFWFRAASPANTLFVNKQAATSGNGSAATPFRNIKDAISAATPGQIVRVVGNGGSDRNFATLADNLPYEIGTNTQDQPLSDGTSLEVPKGVTLMIDSGAVLKMRRSLIGVGSSSAGVDRSGGSLQVLGIPGRDVILTSWLNDTLGTDVESITAKAGDWGGLVFRNTTDRAQARFDYQSKGIFLNYVAHADISYGGGTVIVDSQAQTINAIYIDGEQPTIVHNRISKSQDSAISANPDSFEELTFHTPRFQDGAPAFTSDYNRVGPDIYGNVLVENSTNGLFVRVSTVAGSLPQKLTVSGRFDDTDIVHVIAQNLEILGTPGGPVTDQTAPSVNIVTLTTSSGGSLAAGTYNYRLVLTDENGLEGPASAATGSLVLSSAGSIRLRSLPRATGAYIGRRLYRSDATGGGVYTLVAELDKSSTTFTDVGDSLGRQLTIVTSRDRARTNGRLAIDAGTVVKLEGARIETEFGAQLIAEGSPGKQIIFTSRLDDRYGAGGTFDTNNDRQLPNSAVPSAGNWGGIYVGHMASASIDHALITFAGGVVPVGSNFAGFNAVEVHQAEVRIRNSLFEQNASGTGGTSSGDRSGLFPNAAGTIFVRGAQPVVLDNVFRDNQGAGININANSLNFRLLADYGRSTGISDSEAAYGDNRGALVRDNRFGGNEINGMQVRGETLTTQGIWDDADIVHVLKNEVYIPDFQHYGGLRLQSSSTSSLVVKLQGDNAGFVANGYALDLDDRIGGSLQIIGQPGQPVVLTSLADDSVGAGLGLTGLPFRDTDNDGIRAQNLVPSGEWKGVSIQQYAHDRNVRVHVENERADRNSQDTNGTAGSAEQLGQLAAPGHAGDENLRLGFEIQGFIDSRDDADVFSFSATAGTAVWIDIDRTSQSLDTVVELLDAAGRVIAISDNVGDATSLDPDNTIARTLQWNAVNAQAPNPGVSSDLYTLSAMDAGFRVLLPGAVGGQQSYFVRVRSRGAGAVATLGGLTSGVYQLQVRTQEIDEVPGSQITYADIRYAETGISITGQPLHSPIVGESGESETGTGVSSVTIGNLMNSDRAALYLAGRLGSPVGGNRETAQYDVDFWEFEVKYDKIQMIGGVALKAPHVPVTIDLDFADGFSRANVTAAVYDANNKLILIGRDSNISDDQPRPLSGTDIGDLSRGSNGKLDPFIGPVELLAGKYRLAIFPNDIAPKVLNQYWDANPTQSLVRLEPINSVQRIAEERFGLDIDNLGNPVPSTTRSTADAPVMDLFTTGTNGSLDPKHAVPFTLGDVTLFVSTTGGTKGADETTISTVDAQTGAFETLLGSFSQSVGDIAMRADGQLHAYSTGPAGNGLETDADTGNYLRIDTGTAAATSIGDDGIVTNLVTAFNTNIPPIPTAAGQHGVGIQFNAMTYKGTQGATLYAVGNRTTAELRTGQTGQVVAPFLRNILYRMDSTTGAVSSPFPDRTLVQIATEGAGTTQREVGVIDTSITNLGLGGDVTGLVYLNDMFYAVDDRGGLYSVDPINATTTFIRKIADVSFAGLTLGPDETEGGRYKDTLFGVTRDGQMYAFNTSGIRQTIFSGGQSSVRLNVNGTITGLAFSTLDRNLWHTTTHRGSQTAEDDGHGVDVPTFDDSVKLDQPGGASLYFGNERSGLDAGNKNTADGNLSSSELVRNVNFPGGAFGAVISNEFSLEGYSASDKPALYFNYFLETENANYLYGTSPDTLMRDSFRVFVADETGQWNLLVTNNSTQLSAQDDEFDYGPFGSTTANPGGQDFPDVVEAFDNTGGWRQARVDLSNYAGRAGLKLRFDFSTAGAMSPGTTLPGDEFGAFNAGFVDGQATRPGSLRGMNNDVEGVYVDDIIIGFAERGEMVTNAAATDEFIPNDDVYNPNYLGRGNVPFQYSGIADGAYDVEIRRASDFGFSQKVNPLNFLYRAIDTNDREVSGIAVTAPSANQIPNRSKFVLSDGWNEITFQFLDAAAGTSAADPGSVGIVFDSRVPATDTFNDSAEKVAAAILQAINSDTVQNLLQVQAVFSGGINRVSSILHLTGNATLTPVGSLATVLKKEVYNGLYGDQNRYRDQGQIIVHSTTVRDSLNFGIDIDAAARDLLDPTPHPGTVKNTQENNDERLTTGVVISNSLIVGNIAGGVRFSGDTGNDPQATVPYGRIINNTIVGAGGGIGILVEQSASPTILNNIVANFGTGVQIDDLSIALGTTLGTTLYQNNGSNTDTGSLGRGSFPLELEDDVQLFVDAANGNFYPAPFSPAVDSSLNSLGDRDSLIRVRNSLNLGISPVLAPGLDLYGQLRGDDEKVATPAAQGANVFIDRGAIDRVDFSAPSASLLVPEDQSSLDLDRLINRVTVNAADDLRELRIRLSDEGIGIDDSRVTSGQFTLLKDGVTLAENVDYVWSFNRVTDEVTFSAVTTFPIEARYQIRVNNSETPVDGVTGVRDLAGNFLRANQTDGSTQFSLVVTDGVNDPPVNVLPGTAAANEDSALVFSTATGNAVSVSDADIRLGTNRLTVSLTATNGQLSLSQVSGLTFAIGNGTGNVTMKFSGDVAAINRALDGLRFLPNPNYFGPASLKMTSEDLGEFSVPPLTLKQDTDTLNFTVRPVNDSPTLNSIANRTVAEDSSQQTVSLAGITAGAGGESQPLRVTATSSNTSIVAAPTVVYTSASTTGLLRFTPAANAFGTVTVTVRVEDGGLDGSLATTGDNLTTTRTFTVTVTPVNDIPTLAAISNISVREDSAAQSINLTGITAGINESQPLKITAVTSNAAVVPSPTVTYTSPQGTGSLSLRPAANAVGVATITVSVEDGGLDGNLATTADNLRVSRQFVVTVTQVNDDPVAGTSSYTVDENYSLLLNANPSFDVDEPQGDVLTYAWDLNNDGIFETAGGTNPLKTVTWAQLAALGYTAPVTRTIQLKVTDSAAKSSTKSATVRTLTVDYGDAPDSFGTLKTSNGAAHTLGGSLFLGTQVDKESTGQPNATATGDGADEDGVLFPTSIEASPTQSLPSFVTVMSSAAGKLDVWLDLNNNGVFDAGEHLNGGVSYTLKAGANRINFTIPAGTTTGNRMMRFRVSSAGRLQPTGRAANGEVEDYRVSVQALQAPVKPAVIKPVDFAPTDGRIAETTDRTPLIEWSLHPANYSYSLELRNAAGATLFSRTALTTTSFDSSTALASGLADGTYSVRLTAANRAGTLSPVTVYSFKVVTLAVSAPTGNSPSARPIIRWNAVPGTTSYFVEIQSLQSGRVVQSGNSTSNSFTPTADLALGQYQVRVRATDAAGLTGDFSSLRLFGVTRNATVTAPGASTASLRPVISWTAVPGAATYEVQLDNNTDGVVNVFQVSGLTTTSWTPPSNLKLARYTVRVTAVTATGFRSIASPDASFLVMPPVAPVSPVPGGSSSLVRVPDSTPTFGWAAMAGADRYELVVRNKQRNNTAIVINQTQLTRNSFTQPTDLPMGHYTYRVRAVNTPATAVTGQQPVFSEYSPEIEFVISTAPVVSQPPAVITTSRPLFQWTLPRGAVSSDLEVREAGGTTVLLRASGISGTTFQATTDLGIGNYTVNVRSNFSDDNPATPAVETEAGDWSVPRSFRVSTPPVTVAPAGRTPDSTPTLSWNAVAGAQTYEISINSDTLPVIDLIHESGLNARSFTVPNTQALPIGRYSWMVRAVNPQGVIGNYSTLKRFEVVTPPVFLNPITSTFDTTPTFSWNNMSTLLQGNPAGAGSYEIVLYEIDPATRRYREYTRQTGLASTTWTVPAALPAGNYRAVVRATSLGLPGANVAPTVSDNSLPMDFHVGGQTTVNRIGTTSDTTPTITWQPVQGATRYEIRITTGGTPDSGLVRQASVTAATWTVPTASALAKGTYRVWVRAVGGSTTGPWSTSVVMTIADVNSPSLQAIPAMAGPSQEQPAEHRVNAGILPADSRFSFVSHAVSMLPAVVVTESTAVPAVVIVPEANSTESNSTDAEITESDSTDAVLAGWDQQLWWQSSETTAPRVGQDSSGTKMPTTASVFGAMLALTPRRLRNRISRNRRKEQ